MSAPEIKHGKEFEKRIDPFFSNLYKDHPVRWERVLDTAAAGNLVRKAESDFKFIRRSRETGAPYTFLLECKSSVDTSCPFYSNFRRFVKSGQNAAIAGMRRGGGTSIILFQRLYDKMIEIWPGRCINEGYPVLRLKLDQKASIVIPDTDEALARFAQSLIFEAEDWCKFLEGEKHALRFHNGFTSRD